MGDSLSHHDIPCHGKHFEIGTLYDCCNEKLLEGFYFWDMKKLKENADTVEELGDFRDTIIIEDASEEKIHHIGLSADAKFTFLSGLLKAESSIGYQYDRTTSTKKSAQATLKFSCKTGYQKINNINIRSELDKDLYETALERKLCGATHVVVRVDYGCEAFFKFVRSVDEKETKHEVHAEMKAVLDRIPKCGGSLEMVASFECGYQEKIKSYSCAYHGDFRLDPQPTTFKDSITAYNLLHKNTKKFPKPLKARIVPLIDIVNFYGFKVPDLKLIPKVRPISENLLFDTQNLLEKLRQKKTELQTLTKHVVCEKLEHFKEQVSGLAKKSIKVENSFKGSISKLIPEIRRYQKGEADLESEIQESMKDSNKVDVNFVKGRVSELSHYLKIIDEVKVGGVSKIELVPEAEVAVKSLEEQRLVCFAFNGDSTINKSDKVTDIARRFNLYYKFKLFYDFAVANRESKTSFIMAEKNPDANLLNSDTGCLSGTILYTNREPSLFVPPSMPRQLHVARDPDSKATTLQWVEPASGTEHILYYIAMMTHKKLRTIHRRTNDKMTTTISIPDSELAVSISPNQEFTFSVRAVTPVGVGPEMKQVWKFPKVQLQVVP